LFSQEPFEWLCFQLGSTPEWSRVAFLELKSVSKAFGGSAALRAVSLTIEPGEQVGLIGENGAGKSTLIKLLAGVHRPDEGEILWQGQIVDFRRPRDAMNAGMATIHQELSYFEKLTVAENLLLGEPWPRTRWGATDWNALYAEARCRLQACELDLDPAAPFHNLSAAQRQEVAIARSLAAEAKLIILDEPTASLTEPEVSRLSAHLQRLRAQGVALIYVSHRLDEILKLTQRVLVLRDGELVAQYPTTETTVRRMVHDMVGRELQPRGTESLPQKGPPLLHVENLACEPFFRDISFTVHGGEILGLGGLVGAGRSKLGRAIFGLYKPTAGKMTLNNEAFLPRHPAEARSRGVVYVPEERKRQGFVLEHSVANGISIGFLQSIAKLGWIRGARETLHVEDAVSRFTIKTRDPQQPVVTLSGGNQQKTLLARWLEIDPSLIILDEPTRGVDVGAKAEIQRLIQRLAAEGKGIILISSDLPELLSVSHRILALHGGRIVSEFRAGAVTQEEVLLAASGELRS
jgi:ABC-type sugar transport system ATPase subunit